MPKSGCCSKLRALAPFAQNVHEGQPSHDCAACIRTFPKSQTRGKSGLSRLSFLRWSQGSASGSRRHRSVRADAVESLKSPTWQISAAGSQQIDHKWTPPRWFADSRLVRCDTAGFSQCGGQVKHAHACTPVAETANQILQRQSARSSASPRQLHVQLSSKHIGRLQVKMLHKSSRAAAKRTPAILT